MCRRADVGRSITLRASQLQVRVKVRSRAVDSRFRPQPVLPHGELHGSCADVGRSITVRASQLQVRVKVRIRAVDSRFRSRPVLPHGELPRQVCRRGSQYHRACQSVAG